MPVKTEKSASVEEGCAFLPGAESGTGWRHWSQLLPPEGSRIGGLRRGEPRQNRQLQVTQW